MSIEITDEMREAAAVALHAQNWGEHDGWESPEHHQAYLNMGDVALAAVAPLIEAQARGRALREAAEGVGSLVIDKELPAQARYGAKMARDVVLLLAGVQK